MKKSKSKEKIKKKDKSSKAVLSKFFENNFTGTIKEKEVHKKIKKKVSPEKKVSP